MIYSLNYAGRHGNRTPYNWKETLVLAGWTVRGSGDGNALYEDVDQGTGGAGTGSGGAYDVWTGTNRGSSASPGDNAYGGAWVRLREPGSTREFIFHRHTTNGNTYDDNWNLILSVTGFTGGAPTHSAPPTSADQKYLKGSAFPSLFPLTDTAQWRTSIVAADTPTNGVYSWVIVGQGAYGQGEFGGWYDAVTQEVPGDAHPFVCHFNKGTAAFDTDVRFDSVSTSNFTGPSAYRNYGQGDEKYSGCPLADLYIVNSTEPNSGIVDSLDVEIGLHAIYASDDNSFYKGVSHMFKHALVRTGFPGQRLISPTEGRLYIGRLSMKWDPTTPAY